MRRSASVVPFLVLLAFTGQSLAEVRYATDNGFFLEVTRDVTASPEASYAQFVRVGEWWNSDHTWFGDAANLSISPEAGGCFCEKAGDRSAFHMLVTYVDPGKAMHLVGGLGPLQGLGLHGAMAWKFEGLDDGGTRIVHSYRVTGYYPEGLQDLAKVVDQVQTGQVEALQARLSVASATTD